MPHLVHDVPADHHGGGGEAAHGDEADAEVADREARVDGQQDGEAGRREEEAEEDEGEAEAEAVREVGGEEAEAEGGGGGGHGVELGFDGGVAKGFDYCGGEVGECYLWCQSVYPLGEMENGQYIGTIAAASVLASFHK